MNLKMKNRQSTNAGITLIALIITIIVMLILVSVSISIAINSDLFHSAGKATKDTKNAIGEEQKLAGGMINVDGKIYESIEDYVAGEERVIDLENLVIGSYIEGYDPSIAEDGSTINTSYTSQGAESGGTSTTDGTSGNGHSNQTFTVKSITKWRVVGEEDGQIIITAADPIKTDAGNDYYLKGQAGYMNIKEELNKISGIYGQGRYADTSKYNYTINAGTIESAGRCIELKDIGYTVSTTTTPTTYTKNEENGKIYSNGSTDDKSTTFNYYGEDAVPSQGSKWKTLKNGESVTLAGEAYSYVAEKRTTKQNEMVFNTMDGSNADYWLASTYKVFFDSKVFYRMRVVARSTLYVPNDFCYSDINNAYSWSHGIRPTVCLKSDIQLSYNSKTETYTIK